jgi:SAM-dependent methyltransferase
MKLSDSDKNEVNKRYTNRFNEFGYSPKSLGWDKGKQGLRSEILTSQYDFENKRILDIGCGFGDLNIVLQQKAKHYNYFGVDVVDVLVQAGKELYKKPEIEFYTGDFLDKSFTGEFDYAIASGMFNFKLKDGDNYEFIENVMQKALQLCKDGIAFDFLSDKVDYQKEITFHSSPERILAIAYKFSRNIILRNDYMPFEFSVFINKNDSFSNEDTVFNAFKNKLG